MESIRILLVSDNHSFVSNELDPYISWADEIWHAGDIGDLESLSPFLSSGKKFRAVYGNIDTADIRFAYPSEISFEIGGIHVFMTHIGGYPRKYAPNIARKLQALKPDLFICGHSHILKVLPDPKFSLIHMNPGAYGHHGFHKIRTVLKFEISGGKIEAVEAVELGLRGTVK